MPTTSVGVSTGIKNTGAGQGTPKTIVITIQPINISVGANGTFSAKVLLPDAITTDTNYNESWTLVLNDIGDAGASLTGTVNGNFTSGTATMNAWSVDTAGTFALTVTSGGLSRTTQTFEATMDV